MGAPKWAYVALFVFSILGVCSSNRMPLSKMIQEDPDDQPYKLSSTIDNVFFGTWGRTEGGGDDPPDDDGIGAMGPSSPSPHDDDGIGAMGSLYPPPSEDGIGSISQAEGRGEVDSAITELDKCDGIGGSGRAEGGGGIDSAITKLAKCDTDDDGIGVMGSPSPPPSPYDGIGTWDQIEGGGDDDSLDDDGIGTWDQIEGGGDDDSLDDDGIVAMGPPSTPPGPKDGIGTWGQIEGRGDDDLPDDDGIGAMGPPSSPPPSPKDGIGTWGRIDGNDDPPDDDGIGATGQDEGGEGVDSAITKLANSIQEWTSVIKGDISPTARTHGGNDGQIRKP